MLRQSSRSYKCYNTYEMKPENKFSIDTERTSTVTANGQIMSVIGKWPRLVLSVLKHYNFL